ncbi:branched-chain amino acid ABC transporter permease [Pseudolabrys taiwanensis]|uniref:Branched-chain amino acid ABC transporter permease n=1 Tax=Pseudolabrys taiwanensis TaxID=331696 RepID=A0A346A1B4_9HYPH|nr:branched-chain amino acid ABC transporter permease [Pseudolabrys taiwanensis]AXK82961.1 branched-chain amino acid ABC transporter permease [Pseudolabrys taiwanensis]
MNSLITIWAKARGNLVALVLWGLAAALILYSYVTGGYFIAVLHFAFIYTVLVTGLNIFMGFTGQVSFGHNAFAAIGGYTSAVLTATYGWEPLSAGLVGLAGALICALVIGYPVLRLRGHYLAMATLAIGLIVYEVAVQWDSVTKGYMGIAGIPPLGIGAYTVTSDRGILVFLLIVAALALLSAAGIRRSRLGRAFVAAAGSEDAARALGIDVARYKLIAFMISAAYAAIAGSLFVHAVGFVSPEVFGLPMVVLSFTMLYVGGIGTIAGPALGAIIISALPESFRTFKDYQDLAYGAALIAILIYAPRGLASLPELWARWRGRKA